MISTMDESVIQEDEDVARERARLANTDWQTLFNTEKLVLSQLSKYYGPNLVVNSISVGIPQGECFGLLGVNGAGKTTTFKMLTGDETVSSGNAYLSGHSVISQIAEVLFHFYFSFSLWRGGDINNLISNIRGILNFNAIINNDFLT